MATCAGRKKMVFSFLLHVCQPPPVCRFHSQGRDLFTTLAVSVFPLCLILEKQIWGCLAQNVLSAVCITLRKQKVFKIALYYYRYLPFSHFWLCPCFSFCSQMHFIHCRWLPPCYLIKSYNLQIRNEVMCHCVVKPQGRCWLIFLSNAIIFKLQLFIGANWWEKCELKSFLMRE